MHIVDTDLCRRLDTEVGTVIVEMVILNKVNFTSGGRLCFLLLFMDGIPLMAVCLLLLVHLASWYLRNECFEM